MGTTLKMMNECKDFQVLHSVLFLTLPLFSKLLSIRFMSFSFRNDISTKNRISNYPIFCNKVYHLTVQTKYDYLSKSAFNDQKDMTENKLLINTSQQLFYFLLIATWQFTFRYNDHFTFINRSWLCKVFVCFT